MKNSTKSITLELFLKILEENHPEMTESVRRKTAYILCDASMDILNKNSEGLSKSMSDAVVDLEKYKKMFRDHIEDIQATTKTMYSSFRSQGFVKPEIDKKTNKPFLKGRTTMVDEMVVFLNRLNKEVKKTDDAADGASGGFKKLSSAAKGIGTALKASGIGLIIGALAGLKSAFESNSETARGFSIVLETISILFNQTVGAIVDAVKAAYDATGGFNALGKVLGGILNIALTPLKLAFYGIKLGVQELQLAWEKSFLGDKDPKTIKELRKNIKETQKDIDKVGKDFMKSGKDIYENFGEAVGEMVVLGVKGVEQISKISIKGAIAQASALVDARNAAAVAAAAQGVLIEKYDRTAEKLRQVRDEERNSITERMQANQDLKKVLDDQEKAMLAQADLQIQAAQLEYNKNKTTENNVALLEAQANRQGVLAQIEGM